MSRHPAASHDVAGSTPAAAGNGGSPANPDHGIWILVIGELTLFAMLFWTYLSARSDDPLQFSAWQQGLHAEIGLINTIILLTGSWLAASAMAALRRFAHARAATLLLWTMGCSMGFIVIKSAEYGIYLTRPVDTGESGLFTYYFILTGIHLVHMVIATVLLGMSVTVARNQAAGQMSALPECAALYWHMVDIIWLVLFFLLYVG